MRSDKSKEWKGREVMEGTGMQGMLGWRVEGTGVLREWKARERGQEGRGLLSAGEIVKYIYKRKHHIFIL